MSHETTARQILGQAAKMAQERSGRDIGLLLEQCLLPAMLRDASKLGSEYIGSLYDSQEFDHIADWLVASVSAELKWLKNIDDQGVPRKFSKLSSVAGVQAEASRGLERILREKAIPALVYDAPELVAELENGYRIVSLRTPGALAHESKEMQHCVGLGGYDEGVVNGTTEILSLRDRSGKAHVTLELQKGDELSVLVDEIVQIKGKQNKFPIQRYFDILIPWITAQGYNVNERELAGGYFKQRGGAIRHVTDITPDEQIEGDLTLRFYGDPNVDLILPNGLRIEGGLTIHAEYAVDKRVVFGKGTVIGRQLETFGAAVAGIENVTAAGVRVIAGSIGPVPDGSRFLAKIYISGAVFGDLLERAIFENGVEIADVNRVTVPSAISVRGHLTVSRADYVKVDAGAAIPGCISINGSIRNTEVTVGAGVKVAETLAFSYCDISLGSSLQVGGELIVQYATLEQLPFDIDVGGLRMKYVHGLSSIPSSAVIRGDVHLLDTHITSLDGRKDWPGDLRIPKMNIRHLPYSLDVAGSLEVSYTPLVEFPGGMRIGGALTAVGCSAGTIPEDAVIGGGINLMRNHAAAIPDGFQVNGDLKLDGAFFRALPNDVRVAGMLWLGGLPVDRITRNITAASYVLSEAFVIDLSDLTDVSDSVWVAAKDASKLPKGMRIGGRLIVQGTAPDARLPEDLIVKEYLRAESDEMLESLVPVTATLGGTRVMPKL
jgi:hypothetical protein